MRIDILKTIGIACISLVCAARLHAQQRPQYSQYLNNQFLLNPAVAGTADAPDMRAGLRAQWAGFNDAPRSLYFTVQTAAGKQGGGRLGRSRFAKSYFHGLGASVLSDVTGPTSRTSFYLAYAFHQKLSKDITASLGVFGGLQQFALNGDKLRFADPTNATVSGFSKVFPDAGVGLWVYGKRFFAGGSILQILRNQFSTEDAKQGIYVAQRHLYATVGLNLTPTKEWTIIPSILAKYTGAAPASVDVSCKVKYMNQIWGGASLRTHDAVALMFGLTLSNQFDASYSYDIVYSAIGPNQYGSHELALAYRLAATSKVRSPSDFWK